MSRAATSCKAQKCKQPIRAKGYCGRHYKKWRRGELPKPRYKSCKEENCKKAMKAKGYCGAHYEAWSKSRKINQQKTKKLEKAATAEKLKIETPAEAVPSQPAATE